MHGFLGLEELASMLISKCLKASLLPGIIVIKTRTSQLLTHKVIRKLSLFRTGV